LADSTVCPLLRHAAGRSPSSLKSYTGRTGRQQVRMKLGMLTLAATNSNAPRPTALA